MTAKQFRESVEYAELMERVRNQRKGFTFTIRYFDMSERQARAMKILMRDCELARYIECVSVGLSIHGDLVEMEYRRI